MLGRAATHDLLSVSSILDVLPVAELLFLRAGESPAAFDADDEAESSRARLAAWLSEVGDAGRLCPEGVEESDMMLTMKLRARLYE